MFAFLRDRLPVFWQNFLAGLLIVGVLIGARNISFVKNWEDWAVDIMISLNAGLERMTGRRHGHDELRFTILDMDEMSYRHKNWNEPYHVPRDKLLQLIKFAVKGAASIIVVDVDLSKAGIDPQADATLLSYLQTYPASAPPLILMRSKRAELGRSLSDPGAFRPSLIGKGAGDNIHFAQPLFLRDMKDRVVRRWVLMERGCSKDETGEKGIVLPSVQLLTYALLKDQRAGGRRHLDELREALAQNRPADCRPETIKAPYRPIRIGATTFKVQEPGERLIYSIAWPKLGQKDEKALPLASSPDLKTVPAVFVTDRGLRAYEEVADRVTIIGASYRASHDLHLTPLGIMPGALVILNAVKSLTLFEQISQPPLLLRLPLLLGFVLLISLVFSSFNNILKVVVVTGLVLIFFVPISFWFFKYGIWFDFGILLLAIKLQHSLVDYLEMREMRRLKRRLQQQEQWETFRYETEAPEQASAEAVAKARSDGDDVTVEVRLRRQPDGSYKASTSGGAAAPLSFDIAASKLRKGAQGYVLELDTESALRQVDKTTRPGKTS